MNDKMPDKKDGCCGDGACNCHEEKSCDSKAGCKCEKKEACCSDGKCEECKK